MALQLRSVVAEGTAKCYSIVASVACLIRGELVSCVRFVAICSIVFDSWPSSCLIRGEMDHCVRFVARWFMVFDSWRSSCLIRAKWIIVFDSWRDASSCLIRGEMDHRI